MSVVTTKLFNIVHFRENNNTNETVRAQISLRNKMFNILTRYIVIKKKKKNSH